MKISFNDKSYIEITKSISGKIIVSIQAKDYEDKLKTITNSVELTDAQFKELITSIS